MADDETSSADPQALLNFAEVGLRIDAQLEAGGMQLQNALDAFAATCTEYGLGGGIDLSLADQLRDFARRGVEFDLWVRSVAEQFVQADTGSVLNPTIGFNTDGGFATQDLGLAASPQSILSALPPDVAAQVMVLLDAGDVHSALELAGTLPASGDDAEGVLEQVELTANGTPSADNPDSWEPIVPLSVVPNAADPYAIEGALERPQVQQFWSPVQGIDLSNRQADPWDIALDSLKIVLGAAGDAPSDCNDAFARVAQAVPKGPDAVRDALEKSRPGCSESRSLIRLSGVMADGTPIDVQAEATLNQFAQQMTAMADALGGGSGGRRPGGIAGSDATRVLSPAEQVTKQRLEALPEMAGREFAPGAHTGEEVVDNLGNHYDFLGEPRASQFWNKTQFFASIKRHLLKSNTLTVIDLTGFTEPQIKDVLDYLNTLSAPDLARVIRIGF